MAVKVKTPLVLISALSISAILWACNVGGQTCENEILDRADSPDNKFSVFVFSRNCGATTGENVQVSVTKFGKIPKEKGNALIMDQTPTYGVAYRPVWKNVDTVYLKVSEKSRIFYQENKVIGVNIVYITSNKSD